MWWSNVLSVEKEGAVKKRSIVSWVSGTGVLVSAALVLAEGFTNPPESASALSRVGGRIAQIADASAATVNPANMLDIKGSAVSATVTVGNGKRKFTSVTGVKDESTDPWSYLPAVFAVHTIVPDRVAVGAGLTVPFGRFTRWEKDVSFAGMTPHYSSAYVVGLSPAVAFRVADSLTAAVGVNFYFSTLEAEQVMPWGIAKQEGDGYAIGANAALTWRPAERHAVALVCRSGFDVDYDGDTDLGAVPPATGLQRASDFRSTIKYPTSVAVGYGVEVTSRLSLEMDVEWFQHSRNDEIMNDIGANNPLLHNPMTTPPDEMNRPGVFEQDWTDEWRWGFGMGYKLDDALTLRAGYIFLPTPSPSRTLLPVQSENDVGVVSVGLGWKRGSHSFDVGYAYGIIGKRRVDDNVVPPVNGEYAFESHLGSLAYGYAF
jgi:long-chain fatty acid transport protein